MSYFYHITKKLYFFFYQYTRKNDSFFFYRIKLIGNFYLFHLTKLINNFFLFHLVINMKIDFFLPIQYMNISAGQVQVKIPILNHPINIKLFLYKKLNKPNISQKLEFLLFYKSDQKLFFFLAIKKLITKPIFVDK